MIKVLEKAFTLLETMAAEPERSFSLGELAAGIGDANTTCANILKTMTGRGYVTHDRVRGGYGLGPAARGIDPFVSTDRRLCRAAEEPMGALTRSFGVSGVLSAYRGGQKHFLARYAPDTEVVVNPSVMGQRGLFSTSTGIVLLSCLPDGGLSLPDGESLAVQNFGDTAGLLRAREEILRTGYYYSDQKQNIAECACPLIFEGKSFAVGLYFPKALLGGDFKERIISAMLCTKEEILSALSREEKNNER